MAPAGSGPGLTSRRDWIARLTGGALGSLEQSRNGRFRDPVLTLVHRITQGFSPGEYERARALGFQGYLDEQLDHLSIDDSVADGWLVNYPVVGMSPKEVFDSYEFSITPHQELKSAFVARAVNSRRQLFERMCEFWIDHFNIDHNKDLEWLLLPEHERTVIRLHALGSFPELLSACAFSGAMLFYLDNWLNVRSAPQENYARELLELHTLGVHGGYNESDVAEVAKCFTGWTLNGNADSPDWLRATYDHTQHSPGRKFVLGHEIPSAPPVGRPGQPVERNDAQRVLEILSGHPSTAQFLATKLIRRFLTPAPGQALVEQVANTYLATGGDIKAMLRVILTRENLAHDSPSLAPKYRRPFHLLVSLLRARDATVRRFAASAEHLVDMGHSPYDYAPPTGYPDDFRTWGSSLLPRWTFTAALMRHNVIYGGVVFLSNAALQDRLEIHGDSERPGLAQRMNQRFYGQTLTSHDVAVLQEYIDTYPLAFDLYALFDTLALGASLPGNQWY